MRAIFTFLFSCASVFLYAQKAAEDFTSQEKVHYITLMKLNQFFKAHPTSIAVPLEASKDPLYDTVIQRFFTPGFDRVIALHDTSEPRRMKVIKEQRIYAYALDHLIDLVPKDSLLIEPVRRAVRTEPEKGSPQEEFISNSLTYCAMLNGRKIPMMTLYFSQTGNTILGLFPMVQDPQDAIDVELKYQKRKR